MFTKFQKFSKHRFSFVPEKFPIADVHFDFLQKSYLSTSILSLKFQIRPSIFDHYAQTITINSNLLAAYFNAFSFPSIPTH